MVNYVSIVDLININETEDDCDNEDTQEHDDVSIDINEDCDNEDTQEHDDVSIDINEIGSISLAFDSNFAPVDIEEFNAHIQLK